MRTLVGGAIASVLGLITMVFWFDSLLNILKGIFPPALLIGGCIALYIGYDELKDTWNGDND
ncbi:MAG: hypothetical protein GY714_15495 [Desulfobacterales bacterium]|nr:hypothetical protein [Desulfobacterales bacterium]MCP4160162.1 hypothetical protein [Deltaproteobacteria bacterium]